MVSRNFWAIYVYVHLFTFLFMSLLFYFFIHFILFFFSFLCVFCFFFSFIYLNISEFISVALKADLVGDAGEASTTHINNCAGTLRCT